MGLDIAVGILADLHTNDSEGFAYFMGQFAAVNDALRAAHRPLHQEPLDVELWGCDMWGYSGLHYLRRIAAYVGAGQALPDPTDERVAADPVLMASYSEYASPAFAHFLQQECQRLAAVLELPPHLDPESAVVAEAVENHGQSNDRAPLWQRYGIKSFTCYSSCAPAPLLLQS